METFALASVLGASVAVGRAALQRGPFYARFLAMLFTVHIAISLGIYPYVGPLQPLFWCLQLLTLGYLTTVITPGMWPRLAYRLVGWPAHIFMAGTLLAFPWALASVWPGSLPGVALPYAIAALGLYRSHHNPKETVSIDLRATADPGAVRRETEIVLRQRRFRPRPGERALRIVQITDPHVGPFMSAERLATLCAEARAQEPDLILLTGDYLTVPSQDHPRHLAQGLAPLRGHPHVYAIFGNHDHESPALVKAALREAGVRLLSDEVVAIDTHMGPVDLVGLEHRWRSRAEAYARVFAAVPRRPGALRLVLLHDPSGFAQLPPGEADLVLAGHTHGGQFGLLTWGINWTLLRMVGLPDHGPWVGRGNRMYVHRGTGFYGFPLRIGVHGEESLLDLRW